MSPDLQRAIDRWLGGPLCFVLTLWDRLCRLLSRRLGPKAAPRRIMFIELAEIGGMVVAHPALLHTQRRFPDAELYFLTFARGQGILDLLDIIPPQRRFIIRSHPLPAFLLDTWRALAAMRRAGIDTCVNLESFARFSTMLAFLSGATRRAGFYRFFGEGRYTGDLLTHKVVYNPHIHAAQSFISLVEALAHEPDGQPMVKLPLDEVPLTVPGIGLSHEARAAMTAKLEEAHGGQVDGKKLVILNPNASDLVAARRWPDEYFVELGRDLLEDKDVLLVLTGTSAERDHAAQMAQSWNSRRVLNLAGRTSLPQLIDLYNMASLLVTNDSGPAHFASLTRLPVLVLFGPETPHIYGPLGEHVQVMYLGLACSPCVSAYNQKRTPCTDNRCLTGISPGAVLEQARSILDQSR